VATNVQPLNGDTLGGVKATVRAILGDQRKSWLTDDYLNPIVQHVFRLIILELLKTCSPFITKVVTLPGGPQYPLLPPGTTDLSAWQNDAQKVSLYGLMEPLRLDWKVSGQPDSSYVEVRKTDVLPNFTPASPTPLGRMYWEWRKMVIYLTPLPYLFDLRVRGEFLPDPLIKEDQVIPLHPLMGTVLAEHTAACADRERVNPGSMQLYQVVGDSALENIANALVRDTQDTTTRVARASSRRARRWGPWW
jgi:hypothetical protein